jgi:hypothetical protein
MGSLKESEQALVAGILKASCWAERLLVGDRNFGVFSVACAVVAAQGQALLRLTRSRTSKLARSSRLKLKPGLDARVSWMPSRCDKCPEGLQAAAVEGRLVVVRIQRPGFRSLTLYLFTTLLDESKCPAHELARLYAQRWNIEVCFRYIKTQMDLGFLECHSADMARKEWLAGLIAYNLIRWTMAAAAALEHIDLPLLSFSRARELLLGWLARAPHNVRSWKRLLTRMAKARLPKRRKRRPSEPRAVRPFRKYRAALIGSRQVARQKLARAYAKS